MNIAVLVEGKTEKAFKPHLLKFLSGKLHRNMPKISFISQDGRIPKEDKLKRIVSYLLGTGFDAVVALSDVYTGDHDFRDADDAKRKMRGWVGKNENFYPHVALHDFEAWLLPYWPRIQKLAGCPRQPPGHHPEQVNHHHPPSKHIQNLYESGDRKGKYSYSKSRDAHKILENQDLTIAANQCPELKLFLNTLLSLAGSQESDLL